MKRRICCAVLAVITVFALVACGKKTDRHNKNAPIIIDQSGKSTAVPNAPEATPEPTMAPPEISGSAICVIDEETGEIVYGKDTESRYYIASISKLLTALTAMDWVDTEENVTVKSGWLNLVKTDTSIDCYGLKAGDRVNVGDLFSMALVKSYGDAAECLRGIAEEKSGRNFIELMNEKAAEIGMTASHFDNTIGLDIGNNFTENYSTAHDAALLAAEAMKYPLIVQNCAGTKVEMKNGKVLSHSSPLLVKGTDDERISVVGGKSGSTKAAGATLAVSLVDNATGKHYAVAYLHGGNTEIIRTEIVYAVKYVISGGTEGKTTK